MQRCSRQSDSGGYSYFVERLHGSSAEYTDSYGRQAPQPAGADASRRPHTREGRSGEGLRGTHANSGHSGLTILLWTQGILGTKCDYFRETALGSKIEDIPRKKEFSSGTPFFPSSPPAAISSTPSGNRAWSLETSVPFPARAGNR